MGFFCIKVKSRKSLCVFLSLILFLFVSSEFVSAFSTRKSDADNINDRIDFLNDLGIFPNLDSENCKITVIPETFSAVYEKYNELQKSAGYDLSSYKGCDVSVYQYSFKNENFPNELFVHLIVYEKEIIGGDICDNRLNGEMYPLKKNYERYTIR